jgi:hypothetical protein
VLDLATITCPNGTAATTNLNPAGVPTLCGDAFDTWFDTQVPPGPKQATAVADATLDRSDPNTNDGANPRLLLVGYQQRTVIGFAPDELQAFLDANPLASARLLLSSADTSVSAANLWLKATPLAGAFVEGNGNAAGAIAARAAARPGAAPRTSRSATSWRNASRTGRACSVRGAARR